jgi:hypothetical protein
MSDLDNQTEQIDPKAEHLSGRRDLFAKAGAAAAVAAVAGLAASKSAEAADGSHIVIGAANDGTATTQLEGGSSFYVVGGTSANGNTSSIRGASSADDHAGVKGEASGSAGFGVYGISTGKGGAGVRGENSGLDGSGVYGSTTANGTGGGGVYGRNSGNGHGVKGQALNAAGAGVYGLHAEPGGRGVYGHHDNSTQVGTGVIGVAALGVGVDGRGTQFDLRAGSSGRLGLDKAGNAGSPTDSGAVGTIARDSTGNLWYCYAANKWQRLGSPDAAGAYHSIEPTRVFDSRRASTPGSGAFAAGSSRVISIKDGRDLTTGVVVVADIVPASATAITFNVTATETTAPSFLAVGPGDAATFKASSLNWSAGGATLANGTSVKLDGSRQVKVFAGPNGTFHAIIDVTGYYL